MCTAGAGTLPRIGWVASTWDGGSAYVAIFYRALRMEERQKLKATEPRHGEAAGGNSEWCATDGDTADKWARRVRVLRLV
jgi:hypothetical protein